MVDEGENKQVTAQCREVGQPEVSEVFVFCGSGF